MSSNNESEVRERMIRFIKTHYAKTLGKDIELLDQPDGLEKLHQKYYVGAQKTEEGKKRLL